MVDTDQFHQFCAPSMAALHAGAFLEEARDRGGFGKERNMAKVDL